MKFRHASAALFFAAAIFPATVSADDEDEPTITNLRGSEAISIDSGVTLTVTQEIDGEYAGTISGKGSFVKAGEANLTLAEGAAVSLPTGSITVKAGTLTICDGVTLPESEYYIYNSGTIVLSMNEDYSSNLVIAIDKDADSAGTVVSNGAGTLVVESLGGAYLRVAAGTLTVLNGTAFDEIEVYSGATLNIGDGSVGSTSNLSGNVSLESRATLVFNRPSSSAQINTDAVISGEGDVKFVGGQTFYFTSSEDQTYTGTTTVESGGMIFRQEDSDAAAPALYSSKITVSGGSGAMFGGNVTVMGDVEVGGTAFSSYSDWTDTFGAGTWGAWYLGAGTLIAEGGQTLTIEGDLKIAATELEYYVVSSASEAIVSDGEYYYNIEGNSGGALRIEFDGNGAGKIVANGNVELGGTLILVAASGLETGTIAVVFESDPEKTTGTFDQIIYGSSNVTLLLPGVGGIQEGQYGIAIVESRNVRERASFSEHVGLSSFVDYIVEQAEIGTNKIAQAVALADGSDVTDVVNNFSALAYASLAEMAMRQSDSELDMILHDVARARLAPPESRDGVRVPANFTFFSGVLTDFIEHKSENDTPICDISSVGVYAGGHTWIDDERMAGVSLGLHRSSARPHGNGGSIDDAAARARLFAVFAPKFSEWFLTIGGAFGAHHYDVGRKTALGENTGSTSGLDASVFAAFNLRQPITEDLFFTPYLRFEYDFCYVGGIDESGSDSRLNVRHIIFNNYRARVGSGIEYAAGEGKTFGVDFGFVGTFGEKPEIVSEFAAYDGSRTKIRGTVAESVSGEIAPRVELDFGDGWSAGAVWRVQCSFEGSVSQSFGIGVSKRF